MQDPNTQAFIRRQYGTDHMNEEELQSHLLKLRPPVKASKQLAARARLYLFADRYLIDSIKSLCLHELHRDLLHFKLTAATVPEVFELLKLINNGTSSDTIVAGDNVKLGICKEKELREPVIAYAAVQVEELVKYDAFKRMLAEGGDLVAEFTCLIASRIMR